MLHQINVSGRHFIKLLDLIVFLLLFSVCASGQTGNTAADSLDIEEPEAFDLIELGDKLKEANSDYNKIHDRMEAGKKILELDTSLSKFSEKLNVEKEAYVRFKEVSPNCQKLENMIKRWRSFDERLNQWHSSVDAHQSKSKADKEDILFKLTSWQLTLGKAVEEQAPDVVVEDLRNTSLKLDSFINELSVQDDKMLELERKLKQAT